MSVDYGNESTSSASDRLIEEIRQGLERVIETVKNYAIAFEALDGMRGRQPLQRCPEDRISLTLVSQTKSKVHITRRFLLYNFSSVTAMIPLSCFIFSVSFPFVSDHDTRLF